MRALFIASLVVLTACQSEIDGKTAADVKEAPVVEQPAAKPAAAGATMVFSNEGSKIEFIGAKVTKDHPGGFNSFNGTATVADGQVTSAQVDIDLSTIFTDSEKLTKHLMSDDFFDVAQFGKATFETTKIEAGGEGGTHTVTGNLSFHGANKQISFPATINVADGSGSVKAEFTIKRNDFGLVYPGKPDDLIKDEVLIRLDVALAPKAS